MSVLKIKKDNEWITVNSPLSEELPLGIQYGGTGSTTAADARNNLDAMAKTNPTGTGSFSLNRLANTTIGDYSFTEGASNTASGQSSHAGGQRTEASGLCSYAEGELTEASGRSAHAEGHSSVASGDFSHAEGSSTAEGDYSHAEGSSTTASGDYSHAEGGTNVATGEYSHVEGRDSIAGGKCSHAEGNFTRANGNYSHAEGSGTFSYRAFQHVEGSFNILDEEGKDAGQRGKYIHITGNGSGSSSRSNAHTLDWDGNAWYAGNIDAVNLLLRDANGVQSTLSKEGIDKANSAISITQIWENGSPESSFAAQTVPLDLNGYALVLVVFALQTTYPNTTITAVGVVDKAVSTNPYYYNSEYSLYRFFRANDTGLYFDVGYRNSTTNNNVLIPRNIYGFKGVT